MGDKETIPSRAIWSGNLVHGNLGDDSYHEQEHNSTIYGDGGNDLIDFDGCQWANKDVFTVTLGMIRYWKHSNTTVYGGQGDDVLTCRESGVFGGVGIGTNDLVYGNLGNDLITDTSTAPGIRLHDVRRSGQRHDRERVANNYIMNGGLGNDLFGDSYGTALRATPGTPPPSRTS